MTTIFDNRVTASAETKRRLPNSTKYMLAQQIASMQDRGVSSKARVRAIAQEYCVDAASVYRWINKFRSGELAPESARKSSQITEAMLEVFYAHHGVLTETCDDLTNCGQWTLGLSAFSKAMKAEVDHLILKAANQDEQSWRLLGTYIRYETPNRNDEWQIDSKELPVLVETESGELVKATVTAAIDGRTRLIMGYCLHLGPANSESTIATMVSAIRPRWRSVEVSSDETVDVMIGGAPLSLLCDNATEFLSGHMGAALVDWGVVAMPVAEYTGNLKGKIERFNRTADNWASQFVPWTDGPKDLRGNEPYRDAGGDTIMTGEELATHFAQFIDEYNFMNPHRAHGGLTPFEVWCEETLANRDDPNQHLRLVDETVLERHVLMPKGMRKVDRGTVQYDKQRYVSESLAHLPTPKVEIRVSRYDDSFIECWVDDRFVCRAWNTRSLSDSEANAIIEGRVETEQVIRKLRRAGAGIAARRQADRVVTTPATTKATTPATTGSAVLTSVDFPTSGLAPSTVAAEIVLSLDEPFKRTP